MKWYTHPHPLLRLNTLSRLKGLELCMCFVVWNCFPIPCNPVWGCFFTMVCFKSIKNEWITMYLLFVLFTKKPPAGCEYTMIIQNTPYMFHVWAWASGAPTVAFPTHSWALCYRPSWMKNHRQNGATDVLMVVMINLRTTKHFTPIWGWIFLSIPDISACSCSICPEQ